MKTQLTQLAVSFCTFARLFWNIFATAIQRIWNSCVTKVLRFALILSFTGLSTVLLYEYYKATYGYEHHWYQDYSKRLSDNIVTRKYNDGMTRVYNMNTCKYTTRKLDWVADAPVRDTLTVFSLNGKRGFLNVNDGRRVIEAQYDKAWVFSEGLAAVVKGTSIGFINSKNELVIPFGYYYSYRNGWTIDYIFRDSYCTMTDLRGACGLIDKEGNWVIEPRYDCIWAPNETGFRIVKDGDKYGLLNPELEFVLQIEYDCIGFAEDNAGIILSQNGRKWQTDFSGNITRQFIVDATDWIYIPDFHRDEEDESMVLSDYVRYWIDGKVGVLHRDEGRIVIPAIYESVNMLSGSLFEVQLRQEGSFILIDADGNIVEN
ncbi:MAG: WG repeat-containing protein [Clostridium sp.]|nr:WG repeat-containing protein [Bacteroides sp.]MCM1197575.1 WG repeat-containing protein [Clostridium sp.]